jgi:hypothetical protein
LNFIPLWERKSTRIDIKSHSVIDGTGAAASVAVIQVTLLEMGGVLW